MGLAVRIQHGRTVCHPVPGVPRSGQGEGPSCQRHCCNRYVFNYSSIYLPIYLIGPLFAPGTPPPAIKVFFANIVKSIPGVNRITLDAALDYTTLTRSPENLEAYKKDPLVQGKMSLRTAGAILGGGKFMLNEGWKKFNTPVLIVHGGKDKINSPVASKAFFDKIASADKKYTLLEENYHERTFDAETFQIYLIFIFYPVHQEPEKDAIITSYVEWILEQISKQPVEAAEPAAEPVVVAEPIEASKPVAEPIAEPIAEHIANPEPVVAAETETKSE